jgi:hypothetical protein
MKCLMLINVPLSTRRQGRTSRLQWLVGSLDALVLQSLFEVCVATSSYVLYYMHDL